MTYRGYEITSYDVNSYDEQNTVDTYYIVDGFNDSLGDAIQFWSLDECKQEIDYDIQEQSKLDAYLTLNPPVYSDTF